MSMESRINNLVENFQKYSDWEDRYRHLIKLGKDLPDMPEKYRVEENKVKGCQSQVWLFAEMDEDGIIEFVADSDAAIVKGIIALLLSVYSHATADEILTTKTEFIDQVGLRQHLSMNRSNGLNAMLKQIQIYALAMKAKMQMQKHS